MFQNRRLTAIMFTDIIGYTSIMGIDEERAFDLLKKNRSIQKPFIEKYGGTWLKEMGDGTLANFPSVVDAVYCAKEIQKACANEKDLNLRIGIHLGEVLFEGGDVFGDGVNIASRIEPLASPGGIIITEAVYQNLLNKKGIKTSYIGEQKLKNVSLPVKVYDVKMPGVKRPILINKKGKTINKSSLYVIAAIIIITLGSLLIRVFNSVDKAQTNTEPFPIEENDIRIAVLPFINMSNDPEQDYFSDGITEEIITQMAIVDKLTVINRRSVEKYKDNLVDIATIGKELSVAYVLEGSVRKQAERLRITTKLINTETDKHLWIKHFDRNVIEILDIQIEVAKEVTNALNIQLSLAEIERIERKSSTKFSAYDYYLKAVHEDKKWTEEGTKMAVSYLEKAIAIDPDFSEAHSLLAWQYVNLATLHTSMKREEALEIALPSIKKAIALDSLSSDAYLVYGAVNFYLEWNFEDANKHYEKSMELNSWGEAPIYQCLCAYIEFLIVADQIDKTWNMIEKIKRVDPAFSNIFEYESLLHILNDDDELALATFENKIQYSDTLDWNFNRAYGSILYYVGHYEDAINKLEKSLNLMEERNTLTLLFLSLSYIHTNKINKSKEILEELLSKDKIGVGGLKTYIAIIINELGNEEEALNYLEKAYEERESVLLLYKNFHFMNLKDDPRYNSILEKIGF